MYINNIFIEIINWKFWINIKYKFQISKNNLVKIINAMWKFLIWLILSEFAYPYQPIIDH